MALCLPVLTIDRLLVHASDKDQDGRYYSKSLREVDQLSLVRDRIGRDESDDSGSELVSNADVGNVHEQVAVEPQQEEERHLRPSRQLDLENEWGLHRSRPESQEESEREEKEESETESEGRDAEQYRVGP